MSTASETFLSAAILSLAPQSDMVIVVAGNNEDSVMPVAYANGAIIVRNAEPERGQFSSLQVGLREVLNRGRDAAMVTLVDRPPVLPATITVLLEQFINSDAQTWATVPEYQGKHGHPFLIGREMIEAFLRAPASATARDIEHQHQSHVCYVSVDDPRVTLNVDTPQDYAALQTH